jgi:HPt (histidine-containing phosphotransfer) domain-containing protein
MNSGEAQDNSKSDQAANPPAEPFFDLSHAVRQCCNSYDMFRDMVGFYFDDAIGLMTQINKALAEKDGERLGGTAHELKGTILYLGAPQITATLKNLENARRDLPWDEASSLVEQLTGQLARLEQKLAPHRKTGG